MSKKLYYTAKEVAEMFDITPRVLLSIIKSKQTKFEKVGRGWRIAERFIHKFYTHCIPNKYPPYMSVNDLAKIYKTTVIQINKLIEEKGLPCSRLGNQKVICRTKLRKWEAKQSFNN